MNEGRPGGRSVSHPVAPSVTVEGAVKSESAKDSLRYRFSCRLPSLRPSARPTAGGDNRPVTSVLQDRLLKQPCKWKRKLSVKAAY